MPRPGVKTEQEEQRDSVYCALRSMRVKIVSGLKDKPGASNGKTCRPEAQVESNGWGVGEQGEGVKENCKHDWVGAGTEAHSHYIPSCSVG